MGGAAYWRLRGGTYLSASPPANALGDRPMFGNPTGPWIKTFAWGPCFTFDAGCVWLRTVWKRRIFRHQYLSCGQDWWWEYRRFAP